MSGGGGSSQQQSSGYGYGYNISDTLSQSASATNVWGAQSPALQQGYSQARQMNASQTPAVRQAAFRNYGRVAPQAQNGMNAMSQQAQGRTGLAPFMNPNNGMVNNQLDAMETRLGNFYSDELMPQLGGGAVQSGAGWGGGRQQIATGLAQGRMMDAYQQGASSIMSNAYNQAQSAAGQHAGLVQNAAAQLPGMGADMMNLGMMPFQQAWAPLQQMMGLLGGPTVLSQSAMQTEAGSQSENFTSQQSSGSASHWQIGL